MYKAQINATFSQEEIKLSAVSALKTSLINSMGIDAIGANIDGIEEIESDDDDG